MKKGDTLHISGTTTKNLNGIFLVGKVKVKPVYYTPAPWNVEIQKKSMNANAHLIAAAPELLALCKELVRVFQGSIVEPEHLAASDVAVERAQAIIKQLEE